MQDEPNHKELKKRVETLEIALNDCKQRLKTLDALKASERRFKALIKNSSDSIVILNQEGVQTYVSDAVEKHLGYKPHEVTNIPVIKKMIHPDDIESTLTAFQKIIEEGECGIQYRHRHKNGSWVYLEAWGTNQLNNPDINGVVVNVRNITEWKKAEEALKVSEDKYRHLVENANEAILVVQNGIFLFSNPKGEELFEYSTKELSSKPFVKFIHKEDRDIVRDRHERRLKGESLPDVYPFRIITKSSQIKWVELKVALFSWENAPASLCFMTDITEQYRAEEALEKRIIALTQPVKTSEDIAFEDLFNLRDIQRLQDEFAQATGVASIITKPDGTPITDDSNFCRLCIDIIRKTPQGLKNCFKSDAIIGRYNPEGPIIQTCLSGGLWDAGAAISIGGKHIANWLIGQVRDETQSEDKMRSYARKIGASEKNFIDAFREVPSMSRERFGQIAQFLFTLANRLSTTAYQNIQQARFISEIKRSDKKQKLLQSQLIQAQKMEAIGRLAGGVAHDFNNMLSIILGNTELTLGDINESDPLISNLREIQKAAKRSSNLTRQLLAFASKQAISPQILNLNQAVEGMLKMLRRLIGEDITLSWQPASDLWLINIDPSQIDQLLANLSINARDSIKDVGSVSIETANIHFDEAHCKNHSELRPGDFVLISVSDTGCGMDQETLDNLFEPFFTTKKMGEGTGLGLATVYGIVKQNNGFISIDSKLEKGTTFKIYLPKHLGNHGHMNQPKPKKSILKGSETILIVEDEKAILEMTRMMLQRMGYDVLAASTPTEAIKVSNQSEINKIQLLITDVVMPEMNGKDLAKELLLSHPDLKCLFMSGYTADVIAHHGVLDEGLNFISKPFSKQELSNKLRDVLDN